MKVAYALAALLIVTSAQGRDDSEKRAENALRAARAPFEEAARKIQSKDEDARQDAASFLVYSEELSIHAIAGIPPKQLEPGTERQMIAVSGAETETLLKTLKRRLIQDLLDRRLVPNPAHLGPKPEEERPPARVCDAAYLALRHLLNVAAGHEDEIDYEVGEKIFLFKPEAAKDRIIEKYKKTGIWASISP